MKNLLKKILNKLWEEETRTHQLELTLQKEKLEHSEKIKEGFCETIDELNREVEALKTQNKKLKKFVSDAIKEKYKDLGGEL